MIEGDQSARKVGLFRRRASRLGRRLAGYKVSQQSDGISSNGPHDRNELDNVDPPLTAFVLGDKGLRALETARELMLGQASTLAGSDHQGAKGGLVGRMDGLVDPTGGSCHRPGKLIPRRDYPKNG